MLKLKLDPQLLFQDIRSTLGRFYMVGIVSFIGFLCSIIFISEGTNYFLKDLSAELGIRFAVLAIPIWLASRLQQEVGVLNRPIGWALGLVGTYCAFWLVFSTSIFDTWYWWSLFLFYLLGCCWIVLALFLGSPKNQERELAFWQFSKVLYLRYFTTFLYSSILCAGLCGALGVVQVLFNIKPDFDRYMWIIATIEWLFNPIFFCAGVPKLGTTIATDTYPKGLKNFSQFALLPLVVVYLAVLYAYIVRIVVLQTMPEGIVSYLVMGYTVAGFLAFLLLWPLGIQTWQAQSVGWVRRFLQIFYYSLLPLLVLEAFALWQRISQYGFTEERFILLVLWAWLVVAAFLGIWNKQTRIRLVPQTLAGALVLILLGARPISVYSQTQRFHSLLQSQGLVHGGRLEPLKKSSSTVPPSNNIYYNAYSQIEFLARHNALRPAISGYSNGLEVYNKAFSFGEVYVVDNLGKSGTRKDTIFSYDKLLGNLGIYQEGSPDAYASAPSTSNQVSIPYQATPDQTTYEISAPKDLPLRGAQYLVPAKAILNELGGLRLDQPSFFFELPGQDGDTIFLTPKLQEAVLTLKRKNLKAQEQTLKLATLWDAAAGRTAFNDSLRYLPVRLGKYRGYCVLRFAQVILHPDFNKLYAYRMDWELLLLP
jgi:hypothetical protein